MGWRPSVASGFCPDGNENGGKVDDKKIFKKFGANSTALMGFIGVPQKSFIFRSRQPAHGVLACAMPNFEAFPASEYNFPIPIRMVDRSYANRKTAKIHR